MSSKLSVVALIALCALGCGGAQTPAETELESAETVSDPHAGMAGGMLGVDEQPASITLAPEVAAMWPAVRIRLVDRGTGEESVFDLQLGEPAPLADSGLTVRVEAFVPDFVMDAGGITSRSVDPNNPAAKVLIVEEGKMDYTGWLFGAMPEIHPYPHERYQLLLVEGIRSE